MRLFRYFLVFLSLFCVVMSRAGSAFEIKQWNTRLPAPAGNAINDVIFAHGKWVAVGQGGTILVSTNASDWSVITTSADVNYETVAVNEDRWVVMADSGRVAVSFDALTWVDVPAMEGRMPYDSHATITFGKGRFVGFARSSSASSDQFLESDDGFNWSGKSSASWNFGKIYFTGSTFYSKASDSVWYSKDGENWSLSSSSIASLSQSDQGLFTCGSDGSIYREAGENKWELITRAPQAFDSFCVGNGLTVGFTADSVVVSSGQRWLFEKFARYGEARLLEGNGAFALLEGYASPHLSRMSVSFDGFDWRVTENTLDTPFISMAVGNETIVALTATQIWRSTNAVDWVVSPDSERVHGNGFVGDLVWGNGLFAMSLNNSFTGSAHWVFSSDGLSWTNGAVDAPRGSLSFIRGEFVVAEQVDNGTVLWFSKTGVRWTPVEVRGWQLSQFVSVGDLIFGLGYLQTDQGGKLSWLSSNDWKSWNDEVLPKSFPTSSAAGSADRIVFVTPDKIITRPLSGLYTSVNNRWQFSSVNYCLGQFVAVGSSNVPFSSTDGREWRPFATSPRFGTLPSFAGYHDTILAIADKSLFQTGPIAQSPPFFRLNPRSLEGEAGDKYTIEVNASGSGALSYQWYRDGILLESQTNRVVEADLASGDTNHYFRAEVRSEFGSTFSDFATVSLVTPSIGIRFGDYATLTIDGVVGRRYLLYSSESLGLGVEWFPLNFFEIGAKPSEWIDGVSVLRPKRYYRIQRVE
ncbi:MAG TPA: immunoglobulin domain-containing protein [Candidatus Limnocylindria bacterium]|jgi:hypothetical protein|nr:immunoglobulin domain-containing protein [Candidatus Limnocylindria bacterium]